MSKKKTATDSLEDTTPTQVTVIAWPDSKETRSLSCKLRPDELAEKSDEMAKHQLDANEIEDQKKSSASQFKAQLDGKATGMNRLAHLIRDRAEYRQVKCEWRFEQSGFGNDGAPVFHSEKKTLVRVDTGESVEIRSIADHERQLKLKLDEAAKESEPEVDEAAA